MAQTLGVVDIVWKGRTIPVEKGAKITLGGLKNNPVIYGRWVDRAQEMVATEVEAVTNLRRGDRLSDLMSPDEGELQVVCDTGQTFTVRDAFLVDPVSATGGEGGKVNLKWSGPEAEEVVAS